MKLKNQSKFWQSVAKAKYSLLLLPVLAIAALVAIPTTNVQADSAIDSDESWGPRDRATFTWAEPADYVTFNSITDNPNMGDERNFVRIRKANSEDTLTDSVDLEVGQEYEVWIWYHNNAKAILNTNENHNVGMAQNAYLRVEQPEFVNGGTSAVIRGIIAADNANPKEVWDEAFAHTDSSVLLRYVANSATVHSFGTVDGKVINSEALFGDNGAYLAYWDDLMGTLPGCNEYAGYITYHFVVDQPDFEMTKTVSKDGENNFTYDITANPGDILEFKIDYKNTGTINQMNITGHDHLPDGLTYIEGSSYFTSNTNPTGNTISDNLFTDGVNLGDYHPGDYMSLIYKVKVEDDTNIFPCGDTTVVNDASIATQNGTGHDQAEVTVHRLCDCATNPEMEGCQELPSTGPIEAVIAIVIIAGIGGGGYYLYRSKRTLKTVQKGITGGIEKPAAHKPTTPITPQSHHQPHDQSNPDDKAPHHD